ncbi:FeoA family protein [Vagococcus fessus]|uniref:Ferrous iron transporter FeoA-like domain-containing protein n=1 Tax=Vagococcus fessus TaxID=120370 RepID=A0A430A8P6_9ENTE|nr:ferrous iron transport protein A [Vagococcus fessus]RSU03439.1 hypothetical protein CBF31_06930 [Vagococcus fessus]
MQLTEAVIGQKYYVSELLLTGSSERHLANLGLVAGAPIRVISKKKSGDYIVKVKDSRLAMDDRVVNQIRITSEERQNQVPQTLAEISVGDSVVVDKIVGPKEVKRRLMDMGLTAGTPVVIRKVAPLGDPLELSVRGYELTLRKTEAETIMVKEG